MITFPRVLVRRFAKHTLARNNLDSKTNCENNVAAPELLGSRRRTDPHRLPHHDHSLTRSKISRGCNICLSFQRISFKRSGTAEKMREEWQKYKPRLPLIFASREKTRTVQCLPHVRTNIGMSSYEFLLRWYVIRIQLQRDGFGSCIPVSGPRVWLVGNLVNRAPAIRHRNLALRYPPLNHVQHLGAGIGGELGVAAAAAGAASASSDSRLAKIFRHFLLAYTHRYHRPHGPKRRRQGWRQ